MHSFDETLKKCTADMLFYTSTGNNRDRAKYCAETFDAMYTYGIESHCMYPKNMVFEQYATNKEREGLLTVVSDTRIAFMKTKTNNKNSNDLFLLKHFLFWFFLT